MKEDPSNHTRWKHQWRWHNRGCVWDKIASEWAGAEDWRDNRRRRGSTWDKCRAARFTSTSQSSSEPARHQDELGHGIRRRFSMTRSPVRHWGSLLASPNGPENGRRQCRAVLQSALTHTPARREGVMSTSTRLKCICCSCWCCGSCWW